VTNQRVFSRRPAWFVQPTPFPVPWETGKVPDMPDWFFVHDPLVLGLLALAALAAGLMDSIAGGGGIITVPALLAAGLPPAQALATNKLQAPFGSGMALLRYGRAGLVPPDEVFPAVVFTAVGAVAGTFTVRFLPTAWLTWLIPLVLAVIFVYLLFKPQWGQEPRPARWGRLPFYAVFGLALGFYDGFLGPGTGGPHGNPRSRPGGGDGPDQGGQLHIQRGVLGRFYHPGSGGLGTRLANGRRTGDRSPDRNQAGDDPGGGLHPVGVSRRRGRDLG